MQVTVEYMGQLGHLADRSRESCDMSEGESLTALLERLSVRYGEAFRHIIFDDNGGIRPSLMVLINEGPVEKTDLPVLHEGDQITLLAAIAGG